MSCVRCGGSGLVEFTGGQHRMVFHMRGEIVTREVEASEERPVYKQCGCTTATAEKPPVSQPRGVYE